MLLQQQRGFGWRSRLLADRAPIKGVHHENKYKQETVQKSIAKKKRHDRHTNSGHQGIASKFSQTMTAMANGRQVRHLRKS